MGVEKKLPAQADSLRHTGLIKGAVPVKARPGDFSLGAAGQSLDT